MDAYYSKELKSWVRLERQEDGEWCHTSGYESREAAIGKIPEGRPVSEMPSFLVEDHK
jgi:hypothetical protein